MTASKISCFVNPFINKEQSITRLFASESIAAKIHRFHQSLPKYRPTPLVDLQQLSAKLGVQSIRLKDESQRFDLNAFKVLGASYAVARYLAERLSIKEDQLTFNHILARKAEYQGTTFVTATDGNHGRAVAWAAQKFGCKAVVYMPKGSSPARLNAIQGYGAEASITDVNYDDTVRLASSMAEKNNWVLMQDTAWPGYEKIPQQIMQGYFSLLSETRQQAPEFWPTHVFVQAGVGSLPAAVMASLFSVENKPRPKFIVVEPEGAPCLYQSMSEHNGNASKVSGDLPTIMAGLACGEPSSLALNLLKEGAFAFIKCDDNVARRGMRVLGNPLNGDDSVISGESGAVTLGLIYELLNSSEYSNIKAQLELNGNSNVWLVSSEGDTDPQAYRDVVWG